MFVVEELHRYQLYFNAYSIWMCREGIQYKNMSWYLFDASWLVEVILELVMRDGLSIAYNNIVSVLNWISQS